MKAKMKAKLEALKNKDTIIVFCTFIIFIFTMLYKLTYSALWGDEWVEYFYSQSSMTNGDMYNNIISTFQPPLYNFVMYFWLLVKKSVLWFRLFNVGLGLFSGIFLYKSIRKFYSTIVSCISIISFSLCYQWIYCTQECSEYALMVFCLFGAVYFFLNILEKFTKKDFLLFVLFCIAAMYSQYGAVFVVAPLLISYLIHVVLRKDKSNIILVLATYLVSLIVFAVPLYVFFMRIQMANNEISEHMVAFKIDLIGEYLTELGLIFGYIYNFNKFYAVYNIILALGVLLLVASIVCFIITKDFRKKYILIIFLVSYTLHFILVKLQVYAMGQPGNSGGFLCRYSYFYLAIITIYMVILMKELLSNKYVRYISFLLVGIMCIFCVSSAIDLKDNWHKNLDDVYADIWLDNEGWQDDTYLLGVAVWGFPHYVSRNEKYEDGKSERVYVWVDKENLADRFWLWSSNWSESEYAEIYNYAMAHGYEVKIYDDTKDVGTLAFFYVQ